MTDFYRNPGNANDFSLRGDQKPEVLIFTEGPSESYFMEKWLSSIAKDHNKIAVICFKGDKKKLGPFLRNLMMEENFPSVSGLGFFLDAEQQPAISAIHTIRDLLLGVGLLPHGSTLSAGTQTIGNYRIAIYISPNNTDAGMIEHMVLKEIASSDLHPCIQSFKGTVEQKLGREVHPKSIVQTYMGVLSDGKKCGTGHGFNSSILNVNHPAYDDVREVMLQII